MFGARGVGVVDLVRTYCAVEDCAVFELDGYGFVGAFHEESRLGGG